MQSIEIEYNDRSVRLSNMRMMRFTNVTYENHANQASGSNICYNHTSLNHPHILVARFGVNTGTNFRIGYESHTEQTMADYLTGVAMDQLFTFDANGQVINLSCVGKEMLLSVQDALCYFLRVQKFHGSLTPENIIITDAASGYSKLRNIENNNNRKGYLPGITNDITAFARIILTMLHYRQLKVLCNLYRHLTCIANLTSIADIKHKMDMLFTEHPIYKDVEGQLKYITDCARLSKVDEVKWDLESAFRAPGQLRRINTILENCKNQERWRGATRLNEGGWLFNRVPRCPFSMFHMLKFWRNIIEHEPEISAFDSDEELLDCIMFEAPTLLGDVYDFKFWTIHWEGEEIRHLCTDTDQYETWLNS